MYRTSACILAAGMVTTALGDAWPAEPLSDAVNLTAIEGDGANDFYQDLSGAFWNWQSGVLWVCRNGPGGAQSKLWAIRRMDDGTYAIDERAGQRGEWTGFGDLEGITQVDLDQDVIYAIIEGESLICAFDVSEYGTATVVDTWEVGGWLPDSGGLGAEAITFVADAELAAAGFVGADGRPRQSELGLGGLIFIGHQNGGALFAFDLGSGGQIVFVGEYRTSQTETAGLEYDPSTSTLFVWHDASFDKLGAYGLDSVAIEGVAARQLGLLALFDGPSNANNEGIALMPQSDCCDGGRRFVMAVDDGGADALFLYQAFEYGCAPSCPADVNSDGHIGFEDLLALLSMWGPCAICCEDLDGDGVIGFADLVWVLAAWGPCG